MGTNTARRLIFQVLNIGQIFWFFRHAFYPLAGMEDFGTRLKTVQDAIPLTYNAVGIKKLKDIFTEYKYAVADFPIRYNVLRSECENHYFRIRALIESAETRKFYFTEAVNALRSELDNTISEIEKMTHEDKNKGVNQPGNDRLTTYLQADERAGNSKEDETQYPDRRGLPS